MINKIAQCYCKKKELDSPIHKCQPLNCIYFILNSHNIIQNIHPRFFILSQKINKISKDLHTFADGRCISANIMREIRYVTVSIKSYTMIKSKIPHNFRLLHKSSSSINNNGKNILINTVISTVCLLITQSSLLITSFR